MKLTQKNVIDIIKLYRQGYSQSKIGVLFQVHRATVRYYLVRNKVYDKLKSRSGLIREISNIRKNKKKERAKKIEAEFIKQKNKPVKTYQDYLAEEDKRKEDAIEKAFIHKKTKTP